MAELWRFHLGVHKTATTHIQRVLESQHQELLAKGVDYISHERLRALEPLFRRKELFKRLRFRRAIRSDAPVALVSEENWLGHSFDACKFPIYPHLERRLSVVCRRNAVAFLAIRNPADFATSAYSEAMQHEPNEVSREATRNAFLSGGSPWLGLVARVRKFFPDLRVWPYENYRGNEETYISMLAGIRMQIPLIPDPVETMRLPAETIEALESMRLAGQELPQHGTLEPSGDKTRLELFTDQEKTQLTEMYERDLDLLASGGMLL